MPGAGLMQDQGDDDSIARLERATPTGTVITADAERRYYATDAFWQGATPMAVVRPGCQAEVAGIVATATEAGIAVVPRGGGMSYTRGYTPASERSITLDLSGLDRIIEIDAQNLFVTTEAGCTWQSLYEALRPLGLRTPYFGPMSGMRATVGGALSQNSMFYGSATYGTVADSVLSVKVVLADGSTLVTGSRANRGGIPFHRHYGPDLTGLFLSDTGALGVKLEATIRLIQAPEFVEFASFAFDDFGSMVEVQADIARRRIAAELFGLDPYLNGARTLLKDVKTGLKTLGDVATGARNLGQGIRDAVGIARAGTGFAKGVRYSLHVVCEGESEAVARWRIDEVHRLAAGRGRPMEPTIPKVCRATPFRHPGEFLVGHAGERWVPIHACVPLSKAQAVYEATMRYFDSQRETLERYSIATSHLTGSAGTDLVFEPAFYFPDALTEFQLRNLKPEDAERFRGLPAQPGATEAVQRMLGDLARIFSELGAVNQQIGRFYPYAAALEPNSTRVLGGIKRLLDPKGLINPGALGL